MYGTLDSRVRGNDGLVGFVGWVERSETQRSVYGILDSRVRGNDGLMGFVGWVERSETRRVVTRYPGFPLARE